MPEHNSVGLFYLGWTKKVPVVRTLKLERKKERNKSKKIER